MQDDKLKVLLCSPLGEKGVGGIAKWTWHILDFHKLIKASVELDHFYTSGTVVYDGTSLLKRVINGVRSYVPFLVGLKKTLSEKKYDVVHFCTSASISLIKDILSIKIAHKKGTKAVIHFHFGRIPQIYKQKNWEFRLLDKVIRLSDNVVTMDQTSYNTLADYGYSNISLVPNPLSQTVVDIIQKNSNIQRDERSIVFAGHVIKTKGVFELIAACKQINGIKLSLYGHVQESIRDAIIQEAGENYKQWLEIKGEQSGEEVINAMLSAGVFVLPTYTEGFPNVIIESMACGCPIVTTPVGAIPEMLDIDGGNNCGICVPPMQVEELRLGIIRMLEDRPYALKCGENARKRVTELYSINVVWTQLVGVWQSIKTSK